MQCLNVLFGCRRVPPFKWAERIDKVFVTVSVIAARGVEVDVADEGKLAVKAVSGKDGLRYALNITLFGPVDAQKSKWVGHRDRIDITLFKTGVAQRWFQLLKGEKHHPQLTVDWDKYMDYDEELDDIEIKSGTRGVPVPDREVELKRAVDDYWQRRRVEERERSDMPSLEAVTAKAEKEWQAAGKVGDFGEIVSRIWQAELEERRRQRELDLEEDRWAGWTPSADSRGKEEV